MPSTPSDRTCAPTSMTEASKCIIHGVIVRLVIGKVRMAGQVRYGLDADFHLASAHLPRLVTSDGQASSHQGQIDGWFFGNPGM